MSILTSLASGESTVVESVEPEVVSESDMASLLAIALEESCNDEELEELKEQAETGAVQLTAVEERTIVKLDKKAKKQQLYKVALYQVAREDKSMDYQKLVTLWQGEKALDMRLERKYHTRAMKRMKEMQKTASASKSKKIQKAGSASDRLTRSQKKTQQALSGAKIDAAGARKASALANKLRPR